MLLIKNVFKWNDPTILQGDVSFRCKTLVNGYHIFSVICGYVQLQQMGAMDMISNCYRLQRDLFNGVVASFIRSIIPSMENLNWQFQPVVNA